MRPVDYTEDHGVAATSDLADIRAMLRDAEAIEIPHDKLDTEGFSIDHETVRRWPHVSREELGEVGRFGVAQLGGDGRDR